MHNRDRLPYERYMLKVYGLGVIAELDTLRRSFKKNSNEELLFLLDRYKLPENC